MVLTLGPGELLLAGFIDSRGLIIVGAAFGLLSELGLFDAASDMLLGDDVSARGVIRQAVGAVFGGGMPSIGQVAVLVTTFVGFVLAHTTAVDGLVRGAAVGLSARQAR